MSTDPTVARAWKGLFRLTRMRTKRAFRELQPWPGLSGMRFDGAYREKLTLHDGSIVMVRLLQPGDRSYLQAGLLGLSERSRYLRFHSAKTEFSRDELRYLTQIDQINHVALIAYRRDGVKREGIGVARFVSLTRDRQVAEAALVVSDEFQGKGLGLLLLERLIAAAAERGVRTLSCEVLAENRAARALLEKKLGARVVSREGSSLVLELEVTGCVNA